MPEFNVMTLNGSDPSLASPPKFFIDVPIDVFGGPETRRIEIPRSLAKYILDLQEENSQLKAQLEKANA